MGHKEGGGVRVGGAQGGGYKHLQPNLQLCSAVCSQTLEPFCDDLQSATRVLTSCTPDYLSVGQCNLLRYNGPLDNIYQVQTCPTHHSHTHTTSNGA